MDQVDRDTIQRNIVRLSSLVDLEVLHRELIQRGVIDHLFIERIKVSYQLPQEQAQEFFLNYTKRGPQAFQILIESLEKIGHISEASALRSGRYPLGAESFPAPREFILHPNRNETSNGYYHPNNSSSSNSPTSSTSIPSSPLAQHRPSRVEPLSGGNSPSSSSLSLSVTDPLQSSVTSCTMEDEPALVIEVKRAEQYNMGVQFDEAYPMMSKPRGFALIINNINFLGDSRAKREGAEKDTAHLEQLLQQLGFDVVIRHDVKKRELLERGNGIIEKFINQFCTKPVDACIVAIMSHGKEGHIRSHDAEDLRDTSGNYWHFYDDILKRFNNRHCPSLKGKPKIFIVQACQGSQEDRGVRRTQTDGKNLSASENQSTNIEENWSHLNAPVNIPETEDMVVCYSTVPGFVSNRDVEHGTWYIRSLCKVFMESAWNTEFTKLLRKVGLAMRSITSEYGAKQMSSFHVLGLHHDLYFNPGLYEAVNSGPTYNALNGETNSVDNDLSL